MIITDPGMRSGKRKMRALMMPTPAQQPRPSGVTAIKDVDDLLGIENRKGACGGSQFKASISASLLMEGTDCTAALRDHRGGGIVLGAWWRPRSSLDSRAHHATSRG